MSSTSFLPTPATQSQLLDALADPTLSLRDIAHSHNTTTSALTSWLATPEAQAQVSDFDAAASTRARLIAANQLPAAVQAAAQLLSLFQHEESTYSPDLTTRAKRQSPALDCRARHTTLRAADYLLKITRPPGRGRSPGRFDDPYSRQPHARTTTDDHSNSTSGPPRAPNAAHHNPNPLPAAGRAGEGWAPTPSAEQSPSRTPNAVPSRPAPAAPPFRNPKSQVSKPPPYSALKQALALSKSIQSLPTPDPTSFDLTLKPIELTIPLTAPHTHVATAAGLPRAP